MATEVEIIFAGLISFLNVENLPKENLPAPSAIVMKHRTGGGPEHQTLLAFDSTKVTMTGASPRPIEQSGFHAVELKGETLDFNDTTAAPRIDASFGTVPRFEKYANVTGDWDERYIPKKGKKPTHDDVAAFVSLGGGQLFAGWNTVVQYQFKNKKNEPQGPAICPPREVSYRFSVGDSGLRVTMKPRVGDQRTLTFKPRVSGQPVTVWILSSTHPFAEILHLEPGSYDDAHHFEAFYKSEKKADNATSMYIPKYLGLYCDGSKVEMEMLSQQAHKHDRPIRPAAQKHKQDDLRYEMDAETGYCGPDARP